jgi:peroxiredoxin Q/BCP
MSLSQGDRAPSFSLHDDSGTQVTLDDYAGRQLVVFFYPKAFTPGCTTEACDFRDHHGAFLAAGYDIVGISPDPPQRLADFRRKHSLPFPLLSDPDHKVAAAYGIWGKKKLYSKESRGLIRSTFVIGPDGVIQKVWRNVRAKGHAERALDDITTDRAT